MTQTTINFTLHDVTKKTEIQQFYRDMEQESDRCLSILIAAYFDEALGQLLGNGNSTSFHDRISKARQTHRITVDEYDDLQSIRKLRNSFAHEYLAKTFDEPKTEVIEQLKTLQRRREVLDKHGYSGAKNQLRYVAIAFFVRIANHLWLPDGGPRELWDDRAFPAFLTQ